MRQQTVKETGWQTARRVQHPASQASLPISSLGSGHLPAGRTGDSLPGNWTVFRLSCRHSTQAQTAAGQAEHEREIQEIL